MTQRRAAPVDQSGRILGGASLRPAADDEVNLVGDDGRVNSNKRAALSAIAESAELTPTTVAKARARVIQIDGTETATSSMSSLTKIFTLPESRGSSSGVIAPIRVGLIGVIPVTPSSDQDNHDNAGSNEERCRAEGLQGFCTLANPAAGYLDQGDHSNNGEADHRDPQVRSERCPLRACSCSFTSHLRPRAQNRFISRRRGIRSVANDRPLAIPLMLSLAKLEPQPSRPKNNQRRRQNKNQISGSSPHHVCIWRSDHRSEHAHDDLDFQFNAIIANPDDQCCDANGDEYTSPASPSAQPKLDY